MRETNRIADMPSQERPYEKCLQYGPRYLTDAELLAIIIRTGTRGRGSLEVAAKVLNSSSACPGILGIHHSSIEELMKIPGVGKVKAIQIKCIAELARRFAKAHAAKELQFQEPESIARYYMEDFRHMEKEVCTVLMLDTKCGLLKEVHISTGTNQASLVSPREVFREAVQCNAAQMILMHNHPSGDPSPSREDMALTLRMKECGDLMGVPLSDHIILGDNRFVSLKQMGMLR